MNPAHHAQTGLPPSLGSLRVGEVTLLAIPCADPPIDLQTLENWMSEAERAHIDRFRRSEDRRRALVGRAMTRALLGNHLGIPPSRVRIREGLYGRPELCDPPLTGVDFNVSHSGDWALVGATLGASVGVDVERVRTLADLDSIMDDVLRPDEMLALARMGGAERAERFFSCWTLKEACLKAIGTGLGGGMTNIGLTIPESPLRPITLASLGAGIGEAAGWTSWTGAPAPAHRAAAVTDRRDTRFRSFRWGPSSGWEGWPGDCVVP